MSRLVLFIPSYAGSNFRLEEHFEELVSNASEGTCLNNRNLLAHPLVAVGLVGGLTRAL
ncbi:hypothetical protein AVDCRST_MAG81-2613 [uncultured Synechococcales cyanobacterium]|uniref:Uncharacterized protein n=1 Tax=uncultured Synechococcales cyanobacterium TaxID=1936017 RepID=A0A6J4VGL9_9CYAN|nr:hypothetical protein AVDCRST_MAG81-2613 [uncultured Synechococcales cyanobacterium]